MSIRRMMRLGISACIVWAVSFSVGCGQRTEPSAPTPVAKKEQAIPKQSATKVRLSTSKNAWCSLTLLADAKGYFQEEGVAVELSYTDGGRYCLDALLSSSADLGNIVELNLAFLGFSGNKTVVVVGNTVKSTAMGIVARKSSGITKLSDLAGKKVAFTPATQGDLFVRRLFKKNNMDLGAIDVQKLQPKAIAPALASGSIDAASTWEPFLYACIRTLGDNAIIFRDPDAHIGYMHLAGRIDWVKKNPDAVKAVLRAFRKAELFAAAQPEEAQSMVAKLINADVKEVTDTWQYHQLHLTCDAGELGNAIKVCGELIQAGDPEYASKPLPDYGVYVDSTLFDSANLSK
ncbi:MAG: NrtA/SsuA/CpmA family ABC transporter substrate-binding protein [bacterium]